MGAIAKRGALFIAFILILSTLAQATISKQEVQEDLGDLVVKNDNMLDTLKDINEELAWVKMGIQDGIQDAQQGDRYGVINNIDEAIFEKVLVELMKFPELENMKTILESELSDFESDMQSSDFGEGTVNSVQNLIDDIRDNLDDINSLFINPEGGVEQRLTDADNALDSARIPMLLTDPEGSDFENTGEDLNQALSNIQLVIRAKDQGFDDNPGMLPAAKNVRDLLEDIEDDIGGVIFSPLPDPEDEDMEEVLGLVFDLRQKAIDMREFLEFIDLRATG